MNGRSSAGYDSSNSIDETAPASSVEPTVVDCCTLQPNKNPRNVNKRMV